MKKFVKRGVIATITISTILNFVVSGVFAAIPDAYIYRSTNSTQPHYEYTRTLLASSKSKNDLMYQDYLLKAMSAADWYRYNGLYYSRASLASVYTKLPSNQRTIEAAITGTINTAIHTTIAKESNFSGTKQLYYEGVYVLSSNSSLIVKRPGSADLSLIGWSTVEDSNNASSSVGDLKYVFSNALNKSSANYLSVYLNGSSTEPAKAAEIKSLLFSKPNNSTDNPNEVSSSINATYAGLKLLLKGYNAQQDVTSIRIVGQTTSGSSVSMTINIQ